jgi:subtilisin family serine protease
MKYFPLLTKKPLSIITVGLIITGLSFSLMPTNTTIAADEQSYIVVLKDNISDSRSMAKKHAVSHNAKVSYVYKSALKGYAAKMTSAQAKKLAKDPNVAFVEIDGVMTINTTQTGATWGLDRIDQRSRVLNSTFNYVASGAGVTAYIIDTGVRETHSDFGGRVAGGFDAVDNVLPASDCNGHGTHVAGTVGGTKHGVAKSVSIVPIRVLDCNGSGSWSWIIAGIDYVTQHHQPGQPAVANMSLGGGVSSAVDAAMNRSIADGITYVVAAGNSSRDACQFSPARVPAAITVGATDKIDTKPTWSNYGNCVDLFAPGASITSNWHTSDVAAAALSGTSMASPHVAGVAALYLQKIPGASPAQINNSLYLLSTKSVVLKSKTVKNHLLFTSY